MMIAAYAQHCTLSCYEFQVVASLAWLSSTTHLTMIEALREYFRENRAMRNIRAGGMFCNLIMLLVTTFFSLSSYTIDASVSIQCVFERYSILIGADLLVTNFLFSFMPIIAQYANGFATLYFSKDSSIWSITHRRCCISPKGPRWNEDEFEQWYEHTVQRSPNNPQSEVMIRSLLRKAQKLSAKSTYFAVYLDYQRSFLFILPRLLYGLTYGIGSVITSRQNIPDISNSENMVDLGQIVPLFLLILPIASALETCNGEIHAL